MYGNVGLTTPRGSGTNGYVVRNLSYIRPRQQNSEDSKPPVQSFANRTPNKEILLHEQQRKTEIRLLKYKQELAEKNVPEEEAQEKLAQLRQTLLEKINEMPLEKNLQEHQTHQISEAKARENAKFARAFDIDTDNYVEGSAFDKEYQERKRKERVALREKEREERRKFLIDARDACDACRKKKVKCSGEKPTCANCKRINIPCTYLPSTKKRGPRVGLVESLEKRLQQMEKLLQPLREQGMIDDKSLGSAPKKPRLSNGATFDIFSANPDNGTTSSLSSSDRVYTSPPSSKNLSNLENYNTYQNPIEQTNVWEQPQLNIHNGPLSPSDDVSVDHSKIIDESDDNNSTCQEGHKGDLLFFGKTSAHPGFRRLGECTPPEEGNLSANETSLPNVAQSGIFNASMFQALPYPFAYPHGDSYPPSDIIDHLSLCFFNHMINHTPMFHEPTLRFRLRTRKASPFLVWALCAVAARYSDLPGIAKDPPHSAGDVFAERAISYMAESFDDPNVENVQAILLLCLHSFGSAKGPRSWMYIAMAVRMAQALGMHKEFADVSCMYAKKGNSHQAFIYREIRRRVFWVCFVIDRFSACALGRPTIIDEGDVEIRQPCDDKEWRKEHPAISDMMDDRPAESPVKHGRRFILSTSGVFSSLTSVTILLGRVAQYINRMRSADALPVWDSKSEFAQLENQLESWYGSLGPKLKWSPEMLKYHVGNGTIGAYAAILTLYHVSIVVLNRPNVATLQTGAAPESQLAFFHISADKCITSARRTAKIAEALLEAKCTSLCPFTLYPIFATATMHINDTFSNDKNVVEIAHKNLNITERYLEMVRPYWNIAGKLIHMLKQMRKCRTEDIMCPESTDSGLMEYWNRAHASSKPNSKPDTSFQDVMSDSSLVGLSSFVTPEFLSPRFMTTELPDPWVNFIRSPGIISPRSLVRLSRRDPVVDNTVYNNQDDYFAQDMTLYNVVNNQFAYEGLTDPLVATSLTDLSTTRLYRTPSLFRQLVDQQGLGGGALKEITTANGTNLSAGLASPVIDSLDADFYDNSNLEGEDSRNDNRDKHILPVTL